jgi:hypothetical protein
MRFPWRSPIQTWAAPDVASIHLLNDDIVQRDQQRLSLLAMRQLKSTGVLLSRNWH